MEFRLLGPLTVAHAGSIVPLGTGKPRTVLASLLLAPNLAVSMDQLVEALWGDTPPASAIASLHNHVMRLRRLLGDEGGTRIRAVPPGFLIRVEPGELDSETFMDLCAGGRGALLGGQWEKASADLSAALGLWRGSPLADVSDLHGRNVRILHLVEARSQALEGRMAADLELGRHHEIIDVLYDLTADQPLHEAFYGQLMLALHRADRTTEALDVFEGLQRTLVDHLGVEPSPSIQELRGRIMKADPGLAFETRVGEVGPRFQLPADSRVFTGREHELAELLELVRSAPVGTDAGMVVISAIDGMAGIGKTALAVHAGHLVREEFPDGQLFLDLHGYSTDLEPLTAGDGLDWLLRSLGAAPQTIPADLAERAARYRDLLAGTRTLIVLDNASSAAQVRPLLPGGPGCLVLVTSRKRLTGLEDAYSLALDILPEADAVALLHKVAGPDRIPAHHPAILELLALCGHMPLAVRITAARLRHHPALRIEDVVGQLRDENSRLDHLADQDRGLAAVFDLSYHDLSSAEQHMFRLLGQAPGPDVDAYAAANLAGSDRRTAERLLESLLDHNLLIQHSPGRYRFHDLVRLYARDLLGDEPGGESDGALDRLLDYYQHSALIAGHYLARYVLPDPPSPAPTSTAVPELSDRAGALAWMNAERDNLLAATVQARPERVVALTAAQATFLLQEGPWPQAAALHQAAAGAAQERGDRLGTANALFELGKVRYLTGDDLAAVGLNEQALAIYQELGDRGGEAAALNDLGRARHMTGDFPGAADLQERSLAIYQEIGDRHGQANAAFGLGRVRYVIGDFSAAGSMLELARDMFRELGNRHGEANVLHDLGHVRFTGGDYPAAADTFELAMAIFREVGSRHGEANTLSGLGRVRFLAGDYPAAADLHRQALEVYQEIGNRHAIANAVHNLGRVAYEIGDFSEAMDLYEQALASYQDLGSRHIEAELIHDQGQVHLATGNHQTAGELLGFALDMVRELGDRQAEAHVLNTTGALTAETAGPGEALAFHRQARDIAREIQSPLDEADALFGAARCEARSGERTAALADLREAVAVYRRMGAAGLAAAAEYLGVLEGEAVEVAEAARPE